MFLTWLPRIIREMARLSGRGSAGVCANNATVFHPRASCITLILILCKGCTCVYVYVRISAVVVVVVVVMVRIMA